MRDLVPPLPPACPLCHQSGGTQVLRFAPSAVRHRHSGTERFACTSDAVGTHGPIFWCKQCEVGYSPVPDEAWLRERYATVVDAAYLHQEQHRLDNAARLLAYVEKWQRPGTLLEIGSAAGTLLEAARRRGWRARGIEASKWAVEAGRARYGVDLEVGTIEDTNQQPGAADCVIMIDVLEHLVDPASALRRCYTWVAPGGILALTTVNMTAPIARAMGTRWPGFMDMHLTYFSPASLMSIVTRAHLTPLWLGPAPRRLSLGYVGGRLRGGGRGANVAAWIAMLPGLRDVSVTLKSQDLLLVVGRRATR